MATKTYIPGLWLIASAGHRYGTRWQSQLSAGLTTDQYTCLLSWIAATAALLQCITKPAPGP
jgi:hypothetical protein